MFLVFVTSADETLFGSLLLLGTGGLVVSGKGTVMLGDNVYLQRSLLSWSPVTIAVPRLPGSRIFWGNVTGWSQSSLGTSGEIL